MPSLRSPHHGDTPLLALSGLVLLAGVVVVAAHPAAGEREYLAVFPPWTSQADVALAATDGGATLLALPARFVAAVHSDAADAGLLMRARGALLVLPARAAALCGVRRSRGKRA